MERKPYAGDAAGTAVLVAGRVASFLLQAFLLLNAAHNARVVLSLLNLLPPSTFALPWTAALSLSSSAPTTTAAFSLLLGLVAVAVVRHAYWALIRNTNALPAAFAVAVATFNILFDTTGSLVAAWMAGAGGAQGQDMRVVWAGAARFAVGIGMEVLAEEQRAAFKREPRNKGKPFTGGLNAVVQHPNYLGYALWRSGLLLATGSVVAGAAGAAFNLASFIFSGIPDLQAHNLKRYGEAYRKYSQRTPKLIPFVW